MRATPGGDLAYRTRQVTGNDIDILHPSPHDSFHRLGEGQRGVFAKWRRSVQYRAHSRTGVPYMYNKSVEYIIKVTMARDQDGEERSPTPEECLATAREARLLRYLRSDHVIETDGILLRPYGMVFKPLYCETLQEWIMKQEGVPFYARRHLTIRLIIPSILNALLFIHSRGIIHNDLKPSVIMMDVKGPRLSGFAFAVKAHPPPSTRHDLGDMNR